MLWASPFSKYIIYMNSFNPLNNPLWSGKKHNPSFYTWGNWVKQHAKITWVIGMWSSHGLNLDLPFSKMYIHLSQLSQGYEGCLTWLEQTIERLKSIMG